MSTARSLLLVEDDRPISLALQIRLNAAGFQVSLAASVTEALRLASADMPDVALLDVNLPDGNGIDLMRLIKSNSRAKSMLVVIMSASRKPELRERALAGGASVFLEKPFSSTELLAALNAPDQYKKVS